MGSGNVPMTVTSSWARGLSREIHVDDVSWPNNKPCARKVGPNLRS